MASAKFAVGDRVRLSLEMSATHNPWDIYTISRILPAEANVGQYRVQRDGDRLERAVGESQLVKVTPEQPTAHSQTDAQRDIQRIHNASSMERAHRAAKRH